MIKRVKKNTPAWKVVAKVCDVCKVEYKANDYLECDEFLHISQTCGYGSIFADECVITCDVCQHCVKKLLGPYIKIKEGD